VKALFDLERATRPAVELCTGNLGKLATGPTLIREDGLATSSNSLPNQFERTIGART
jgi:hypothetical protein